MLVLTRNDNGHLTRVNQKQICTIHEHHVAEHFRCIVTYTAVQVSKNKRDDEMSEDS